MPLNEEHIDEAPLKPLVAGTRRYVFRRHYVLGVRIALWFALPFILAPLLVGMTVAFPNVMVWVDLFIGMFYLLMFFSFFSSKLVITDEGILERGLTRSRTFLWTDISTACYGDDANKWDIAFLDFDNNLIGRVNLFRYRKPNHAMQKIGMHVPVAFWPATLAPATQLHIQLERQQAAVQVFFTMYRILHGEPGAKDRALQRITRMSEKGLFAEEEKKELVSILQGVQKHEHEKANNEAFEKWYLRHFAHHLVNHINDVSGYWKISLPLVLLTNAVVVIKAYKNPGRLKHPIIGVAVAVGLLVVVTLMAFAINKAYVHLRFGKALRFLKDHANPLKDSTQEGGENDPLSLDS